MTTLILHTNKFVFCLFLNIGINVSIRFYFHTKSCRLTLEQSESFTSRTCDYIISVFWLQRIIFFIYIYFTRHTCNNLTCPDTLKALTILDPSPRTYKSDSAVCESWNLLQHPFLKCMMRSMTQIHHQRRSVRGIRVRTSGKHRD